MTKKLTPETIRETISKKRAMVEKTKLSLQAMQAKYDTLVNAVNLAELEMKTRFAQEAPQDSSAIVTPQAELPDTAIPDPNPNVGTPATSVAPPPATPAPTPILTAQAPPPKRQRKARAPKIFTNEEPAAQEPEPLPPSDTQPVVSGQTKQEQARQEFERVLTQPNPYADLFKF